METSTLEEKKQVEKVGPNLEFPDLMYFNGIYHLSPIKKVSLMTDGIEVAS